MNSKLAVDVGTGNQWLKSLGLNNLLKFVSDRKMRNRMYYVIELLPNGGYRTLYGSHKFVECKAYVEGQIEQANKIVDIKSANRWLKNIGRSNIYQFEAERPFNGHGKIFCLTKKNERRYA